MRLTGTARISFECLGGFTEMATEHELGVMIENFSSHLQQVAEGVLSLNEKVDRQGMRFDRLEFRMELMQGDVNILKADVGVLKADVGVLKADVADMRPRMVRVEHRLGLEGGSTSLRRAKKRTAKKTTKR